MKQPAKTFPFTMEADGRRFFIIVKRSQMGHGFEILHHIDGHAVRERDWYRAFRGALKRDARKDQGNTEA